MITRTGDGAAGVAQPGAPLPEKRLRWDALLVALAVLVSTQVWRVQDLFPKLALPGLPVLATVVALLLFFLDRDPRRRVHGVNQAVLRTVLGLLVWVGLSVPRSLYPRLSLEFLLIDYLRSVLLMVLIAASVRGLADVRRFAWLQVLGVTLFSAVTMATARVGDEGRLVTVAYYDVNDLAMLIVCTLPLCLYLWRPPAGLRARLLLAAATVLLMMTLGETGSRGGFLGFLAVAGYLLIHFRGLSRAKRVGAVAVLGILLVTLASDRYFARIQTLLQPSADYNWGGKSETGRTEIWKRGIGYMLNHPVTGVGVAMFENAEGTLAPQARARQRYGKSFEWSTAHNSFVQIGAEIGVVGLILFVALLVGAFRTLSVARHAPVGEAAILAQILTASMVAFVVTASFLSQAYSAYFYTLLGMSLGLARIVAPARARAPATRPRFGGWGLGPSPARGTFPSSGAFNRHGR